MSLSHRYQVFWRVYITIHDLDAMTCQSQHRPVTLFLRSISIVHESTEDSNKKDKDLKAKIYHLALKTMLEHM